MTERLQNWRPARGCTLASSLLTREGFSAPPPPSPTHVFDFRKIIHGGRPEPLPKRSPGCDRKPCPVGASWPSRERLSPAGGDVSSKGAFLFWTRLKISAAHVWDLEGHSRVRGGTGGSWAAGEDTGGVGTQGIPTPGLSRPPMRTRTDARSLCRCVHTQPHAGARGRTAADARTALTGAPHPAHQLLACSPVREGRICHVTPILRRRGN